MSIVSSFRDCPQLASPGAHRAEHFLGDGASQERSWFSLSLGRSLSLPVQLVPWLNLQYLLRHRCRKAWVELLSGTFCVIPERTWVPFPGLPPALIRLESLTLQIDFKSILFAWSVSGKRLESQFFFILSCLPSRGAIWGWEGGLSHVVCGSVFSCPRPSWSPFLPVSLVSFSDSRSSFYWFLTITQGLRLLFLFGVWHTAQHSVPDLGL